MKKSLLIFVSILFSFNLLAKNNDSSWYTGPWESSTKFYSCDSKIDTGIKGMTVCGKWMYAQQREVKCENQKCFPNTKPNKFRLRQKSILDN